MTITTSSGFAATVASDAYGVMALVECQAVSGTVRLTDWPMNVEAMGQTWTGVGAIGSVGELHESDDGGAEKLSLTLSPVDIGTRAFALGDPADYQDRVIKIWIAVVDAHTLQIQGAPVLRFVGAMDQMHLQRDGTKVGITMDCRTASYDVRTNPAGLRMNHNQHTSRHPGELGFAYLQSLIGNPTVYQSRAFQAYMYLRNLWNLH